MNEALLMLSDVIAPTEVVNPLKSFIEVGVRLIWTEEPLLMLTVTLLETKFPLTSVLKKFPPMAVTGAPLKTIESASVASKVERAAPLTPVIGDSPWVADAMNLKPPILPSVKVVGGS